MGLKLAARYGSQQSRKLESDGTKIPLGDGAWVVLRRKNYPPYVDLVQRLSRPHRRKIARGVLPEEIGRGFLQRAMAEELVVNWGGIEDDEGLVTGTKGAEIPCRPDLVLAAFRAYPDLYTELDELAGEAEAFRAEETEEAGKSSPTTSAGS